MKKFFIMLSVWFVAIISVVIGSVVYDRFKSSKYDETAAVYLQEVIPQISSWDPVEIRGVMSEEALAAIPDERFERVIKLFSKMGALQKMEEPEFEKIHSEEGVDNARHTIIEYEVAAHYEQGEAKITINLLHQGGAYKVQHFNLSSAALTQ